MQKYRHLTPPYIYRRTKHWWYTRTYPDHPWLTRDAVAHLANYLRPGHRGLEWGSGRSTIWFAKRLAHLTSVEHHAGWYDEINTALQKETLSNVSYLFREDAETYVEVATSFEPESLDFILVDGILRDRCAQAALPILKSGGCLVIDDAHRYLPSDASTPHARTFAQGPASETWDAVWQTIQHWPTTWALNGVSDTFLFTKPL